MSNISEFNFLSVKGSPIIPESVPEELRKRLSLYQVFVKLYEHHGSLLQQILKLENVSEFCLKDKQSHYIQAIVDSNMVYVTTNLRDGKSQSLLQSQHTWTIGRDRNSAIHLNNKYVSRRHAAIRYIDQGFYLIDFNSTNGTCINGEQIYHPTKLEDGDSITVANITFPFFISDNSCILPTVALELLMQLVPKKDDNKIEEHKYYKTRAKNGKLRDSESEQQGSLVNQISPMQTFEEQLSQQWKSDILDRFYSKQAAIEKKI